MGQRLVVQIFDKGERLANCYYHWSGYTYCSAQITEGLINSYEQMKDETFDEDHKKDMCIKAINMLTSTGAGIQNEEEMEYAKKFLERDHLDFDFSEGRNEGLICLTEEGMENSLDWSEATVNIDIGNEIVDFQAFCLLDYKEFFDDNSWGLVNEIDEGVASQEMIDRDTKKVNEYYNKGLISDRSKEYIMGELANGKSYLSDPVEIMNVDFDIDLTEVPFDRFDEVVDMFKEKYDAQDFEFTIGKNKDQVICMIE